MKHTYMAPKATTIKFFSEESLMVTKSLSVGGQNGATIDTKGDYPAHQPDSRTS